MKKTVLVIIIAAAIIVGVGAYIISSDNNKQVANAATVTSSSNTENSAIGSNNINNSKPVNQNTTADKKIENSNVDSQTTTQAKSAKNPNSNANDNQNSNLNNNQNSNSNNSNNSNNSKNNSKNNNSVDNIKSSNANEGSLSFDMQGANSQSKVKATPLTSSELSSFVGTWTFGKAIAYNAGGAAYPDEGIPNLPGKKFTISQNSINLCGKEYSISNYYMTKQSTASSVYGNEGLNSSIKGNNNPMNAQGGYYTLLSANSSDTNPSIADINNGMTNGIHIQFFVVGDKLALDDAGVIFIATKNN